MDLLCFFCLVFVMPLCASVYLCLVVTCWERADLFALVCGILGQVWYLIVSTPGLCTLIYFTKIRALFLHLHSYSLHNSFACWVILIFFNIECSKKKLGTLSECQTVDVAQA